MKDYELIQLLAAGEEEGLRALMKQYAGYVTAILCNMSGGILTTEDVEELSADVFLAVWNNSRNLDPSRPLRPYLAQAARHAAISRLRKLKSVSLPIDEDVISISKEGNPDEMTIQKEQTDIINCAVESFGEPDREIFIRFYFMGERIDIISKYLVMNPGTIKTKLHRCRKRLKAIFEERGYSYE